MLVAHQTRNVAKQRILNALEELVQSLVATGLSLQYPPALALRCCAIGHSPIMTRGMRIRFEFKSRIYTDLQGSDQMNQIRVNPRRSVAYSSMAISTLLLVRPCTLMLTSASPAGKSPFRRSTI